MARNKRGGTNRSQLALSSAYNATVAGTCVEEDSIRRIVPPKQLMWVNGIGSPEVRSKVLWLIAGLLWLSSCWASAATFTVTQSGNTGPGSLPVIINSANATPGNHIIEFSITGTIAMTVPLPVITNSLAIYGRSNVVISGGGSTALFNFGAGTTNVLSALTLRDALSTGSGAAITNAGSLLIAGCTLTNNQAANGGAIANSGLLTLVDSRVIGNRATIPGIGGAVWNSGSLTVSNSLVVLNSAANGGAVANLGLLMLASSTLSNNSATLGFGGGIYCFGDAIINASALLANSAQGSAGQGGTTTNIGGGGGGGGLGGGLFLGSGSVSITNSTMSGNSATGGAGGDYRILGNANGGGNQAGTGYSTAAGFGGGGYGGLGASNVSLIGGFGGGGGGNDGKKNFEVTYPGRVGGFGAGAGAKGEHGPSSGASAGVGGGGGGGGGLGGAIFLQNGVLTSVNCTISSNSVVGGQGGLGGYGPSELNGEAGSGIGGGIFNLAGTVNLLNTIVASSSAGSRSPDLFGNFVSSGFNLIGSSQGATNLSINDYQNVSASLGALQANGGPTLTHALLAGSLAIDAGSNTGAPNADQRGFARPRGLFVDIGAFEYLAASPPTIADQPQSQPFAMGATITLSVTAAGAGPFTYQWRLNGTNLSGATSASLSLLNLSVTNAGRYTVTVSNDGGAVTSSAADVSFFGDLKFIAAAVLAGPVTAQYRVDYADVLGGVTNWLTLTNVTLPYSPFLVIDPNSPGRTNRYYRAVQLP